MRTIPRRELYTDKLLSQIVMVLAVRDPATINVLVRKINETCVTCYCYPPSQCWLRTGWESLEMFAEDGWLFCSQLEIIMWTQSQSFSKRKLETFMAVELKGPFQQNHNDHRKNWNALKSFSLHFLGETVTRCCCKLMFPIVSGILRLNVDVVVKGLLHSFISQLFWQTNKHLQENIQQTPTTWLQHRSTQNNFCFLGQNIPGGGWSSASAPAWLAGSLDSGWKRMTE